MRDVVPHPGPEVLVRGVVTTGPVARAVKAGSCRYEQGQYCHGGARQAADVSQACEVGITSFRHRP